MTLGLFNVDKGLPDLPKETTLERTDFPLQLSMFVTTENDGRMLNVYKVLSFLFFSAVVPSFLSYTRQSMSRP